MNDLYELLMARVRALEFEVVSMREELRELRWDIGDAATDGIVAALDEDDPDGWVGGTDGPDD